MSSVREDVEVNLHEHHFLVAKLLESLVTASLPPSTITGTRLRTVNDTFHKVLEKDRELLGSVKKLVHHQIAQQELHRIQSEIRAKQTKVIQYAAQLRQSQQAISSVLAKHQTILKQVKQPTKVLLDPREVVAYAHRIAGTTSAPREWRSGYPMFGFMPPAPQEQMMRAGVLSRGFVDEIVKTEPERVQYTSTTATSTKADSGTFEDGTLNGIPVGIGAAQAQMPPGWKPGDPVDLPLEAMIHYMGRTTLLEHGISLPDGWKAGDSLPTDAIEILRKKLKIPEKRQPVNEDEIVDDVDRLQKKRRLEQDDNHSMSSEEESSSDSDSEQEQSQKITLSLSDSSDDSDSD